MDLGPVDCLVVVFPGNRFGGEIVPALTDLLARDLVRILDVTFVHKGADGTVTRLEIDGLDREIADRLAELDGDVAGLLNEDDIALVADSLAPDSSAALVVWENVWAAGITEAVRRADGHSVAFERIPAAAAAAALADRPADAKPLAGRPPTRRGPGLLATPARPRDQGQEAVTADADGDLLDQLERLARLHESGALSDDEFKYRKTALLAE